MTELIQISFFDITYTKLDGSTIEPTNDDALIIYSSTNGSVWDYETDSYNNTVVFTAGAPPFSGPQDRSIAWENFPSDKFIKLILSSCLFCKTLK